MKGRAPWWNKAVRGMGAGPETPAGNNLIMPVDPEKSRKGRHQTVVGLTRLPGGIIQDPAMALAYKMRRLLGSMPPSVEDKEIAAQIKARVMARRVQR